MKNEYLMMCLIMSFCIAGLCLTFCLYKIIQMLSGLKEAMLDGLASLFDYQVEIFRKLDK